MNTLMNTESVIRRILSVFFPDRCPYCKTIITPPDTECSECRKNLYSYHHSVLLPCGVICTAAFYYDINNSARRALLDMKFRGAKFNARSLGKALANAVSAQFSDVSADVITCTPMSRDRLKARGFNQAELLARELSNELDIPFDNLLGRKNGARIQHDLSYEERLNNKDLRFYIPDQHKVEGKSIILVDDIVTSGMTMSGCCTLLNSAGAESVNCACVLTAGSYNKTIEIKHSE